MRNITEAIRSAYDPDLIIASLEAYLNKAASCALAAALNGDLSHLEEFKKTLQELGLQTNDHVGIYLEEDTEFVGVGSEDHGYHRGSSYKEGRETAVFEAGWLFGSSGRSFAVGEDKRLVYKYYFYTSHDMGCGDRYSSSDGTLYAEAKYSTFELPFQIYTSTSYASNPVCISNIDMEVTKEEVTAALTTLADAVHQHVPVRIRTAYVVRPHVALTESAYAIIRKAIGAERVEVLVESSAVSQTEFFKAEILEMRDGSTLIANLDTIYLLSELSPDYDSTGWGIRRMYGPDEVSFKVVDISKCVNRLEGIVKKTDKTPEVFAHWDSVSTHGNMTAYDICGHIIGLSEYGSGINQALREADPTYHIQGAILRGGDTVKKAMACITRAILTEWPVGADNVRQLQDNVKVLDA